MKIIDKHEMKFLGFTSLDNIGRTIEYEGKILRGIYPEQEKLVNKIFKSGLISKLVSENVFIPTEISQYTSEKFPLILEHKKITASLPTSWTYSQLKDAAITILKVNEICKNFGYELADAHPYNISFDGITPKWIDFGSIRKKTEWKTEYEEFILSTVVPLTLMKKNYLLEAYSLLLSSLTFKILSRPFKESTYYEKFLEIINIPKEKFRNELINIKWIEDFFKESPDFSDSLWSNYQVNEDQMKLDLEDHAQNRFFRFFMLPKLIQKYSPDAKSTVDLAGSNGLLSAIISKSNIGIEKIINTDYEPTAIEKAYSFVKKNPQFNYESYLLNFMLPIQYKDMEILKSDIALGMAVTHHLLLTQGHKIEEIFEKVSKYTNKYVYIEFMPLGLWGGDIDNKPELPNWYTLDWFRKEFKSTFKFLHEEVLESHIIKHRIYPHRVLFIGKLKNNR